MLLNTTTFFNANFSAAQKYFHVCIFWGTLVMKFAAKRMKKGER